MSFSVVVKFCFVTTTVHAKWFHNMALVVTKLSGISLVVPAAETLGKTCLAAREDVDVLRSGLGNESRK
jgi:hypothetical protein